jgi:hypothetical protein
VTYHIKATIDTENFREQGSEEGMWTCRHKRKAKESCRTGRFVSFTHSQILLGDQSKKYLMDGYVTYVKKIDSLEDQGAGEKLY